MKKSIALCLMIVGILSCAAQSVIDNFNVGPYIVDYLGQGYVKYRLKDNINLYEFFELEKDTTIVVMTTSEPVKKAYEVSGSVGANRFSAKDIGIEGIWKQMIGNNLYFDGGISLNLGLANEGYTAMHRYMLEVGVPLKIEYGNLNRESASLYGAFGLAPTFYSTMKVENQLAPQGVDIKKSGFLIAPALEFGGNIPVGGMIMRIGVYGKYKINCCPGDFDVYTAGAAGRMFLGAKIGIVL